MILGNTGSPFYSICYSWFVKLKNSNNSLHKSPLGDFGLFDKSLATCRTAVDKNDLMAGDFIVNFNRKFQNVRYCSNVLLSFNITEKVFED